jgi:diguanylate cyclase (GGDEF)-like protein
MPELTTASRESPRAMATATPPKKSSKLVYALMLLVWVAFAAVSSGFAVFRNVKAVEDKFNQNCTAYFEHLQEKIRSTDTVLEGFAALFGAIGDTNPEQAKRYARQILSRYPHVFALEITRAVPRRELAAFTADQRRTFSPTFQVKTFSYDSDRKWGTVKDKPVYYPIVFMEPMPPGSEEILGLDVETVPFLRRAMLESIKRQENISSHPFHLVEGNLAYVMFHPVLQNGGTALNEKNVSATPFNVELVVDAAKMVGADVVPVNEPCKIVVYHKDFRADDVEGQILFSVGKSNSKIEKMIFPAFHYEKTVNSTSSPFIVLAEKQMGWRDLNKDLFGFLFFVLSGSLGIVIGFIREHQKAHVLRIKNEELLWDLANHDSLTGLSNRGHFMHQIEQTKSRATRRSEKFGLIFLDLNGFKKINDTYGHNIGDKLLQAVAANLLSKIRVEDSAARLGGDEFVILVDNIYSREKLDVVAEKIADIVQGDLSIDGHGLTVSVSLGTAIFPDDGVDIHDLFECADKKMYKNKRNRSGLAVS